MAQLMDNQGVIVANEPVPTRLAMLEYNLKHLGD
jgi:16S rRNA C967 or C1407 C5-methylase (RsmB/RsmF family)